MMPPKRPASSRTLGSAPKQQRKMLTIVEKVKLLDMLKEGRSYASVGRHYGINESSVRYIKKDESKIRRTAMLTPSNTAKRVVSSRNKIIVKMESALAEWIAECREQHVNLDTNIICRKAKELYDAFAALANSNDTGKHQGKKETDELGPGTSNDFTRKPSFIASRGWFAKFQKRFGLTLRDKNASTNAAALKESVDNDFQRLRKEDNSVSNQVFEIDPTNLLWKSMMARDFMYKDDAKAPEFNPSFHYSSELAPNVPQKSKVDRSARLTRFLGESFTDMTVDSVNDLIDWQSQPFTEQDHVNITKSASEEEDQDREVEVVGLTLERLITLCTVAKNLQQMARDWDDDAARSMHFCTMIDWAMAAYKNILSQKKNSSRQLSITAFLSLKKQPIVSAPFVVLAKGAAEDKGILRDMES